MPTSEELLVCHTMCDLLTDIAYSSHDLRRDKDTLCRRFLNEGFRFLSVAIPRLGKAFDQALDGKSAFILPLGYTKRTGTNFPRFLGSVLSRVFDENGILRDEVDYQLIARLRTFFFYAYKVRRDFDEEEQETFEEKFKATDEDIANWDPATVNSSLLNLVRGQLSDLDDTRLRKPQHGPGVSANIDRTLKDFAYLSIFHPCVIDAGVGYYYHRYDSRPHAELLLLTTFAFLVTYVEVENPFVKAELSPSKVLFVPKDSRGPRTICAEDSRLMWYQKGLQKALYSDIEASRRFSGRINFTDQSVNRNLTCDKSYATIDLKDASDRVSLALVCSVFPSKLLDKLLNCRSPKAKLPSGELVEMGKFAPMGSALCFPVLALMVYTIATSAIYLAGGVLPLRQDRVFVYGDDLIVPNEYASVVMEALEQCGLLVNRDKSFVDSRFTESCGRDDLDGHDITPARCKVLLTKPSRIKVKGRYVLTDDGFSSTVSLTNRLAELGFNTAVNRLRKRISELYGAVPYGVDTSPFPCYHVNVKDVYIYNQAEGIESRGRLKALSIRDQDRIKSYPNASAKLLNFLISYDGENRYSDKICLRKPYLQKRTYTRWGDSYGAMSARG